MIISICDSQKVALHNQTKWATTYDIHERPFEIYANKIISRYVFPIAKINFIKLHKWTDYKS